MEGYDRKVHWKKTQSHLNGLWREFMSRKFESYLVTEGVHHELTIPDNPEQNGVAE